MDVVAVTLKIFNIANSMVGESSLPNFSLALKFHTNRVRIASFDELQRALQGNVDGGRKQQVDVFGHYYKGVQSKSSLSFVAVESFQKQPGVGLDNKDSPALPG
jgi:hypothetical protein